MKDVAIGYVHPEMVDEEWARAMTMVGVRSGDRIHGITQARSTRVNKARTLMVKGFLESPADWLWMVDTDMTMPDYALELLLEIADPEERPVVGGLGFIYNPREEPLISPSIFTEKDGKYYRWMDYPANTLVQVAVTGMYCLLVHRSVFEKLDSMAPYPWFDEQELNGEMYGPDFVFCWRVADAGFPIYVHTGLLLGHVKKELVTESMYRTYRGNRPPS